MTPVRGIYEQPHEEDGFIIRRAVFTAWEMFSAHEADLRYSALMPSMWADKSCYETSGAYVFRQRTFSMN